MTGSGSRARAAAFLVAVWAALTGLLCLVGAGVRHTPAIRSADRHVTAWAVDHRTKTLSDVMKAVTHAGTWYAVAGVVLLVGLLVWRRRLPTVAVVAVLLAWVGEVSAVSIAKAVVARPRPPEAVRLVVAHGWSFPSGHTANAVVVFVTLAAVVTVLADAPTARATAWVLAGCGVGLVAFSRIELGVHWLTDTVASLGTVIVWSFVVVATCRKMSTP